MQVVALYGAFTVSTANGVGIKVGFEGKAFKVRDMSYRIGKVK
jgi:hypothetical protein